MSGITCPFDPERVYGPRHGLTPMRYGELPAGAACAVDGLQSGRRTWEVALQYPLAMPSVEDVPTRGLLMRKMTFAAAFNSDNTWSLMIADEESVAAYTEWIKAWSLRP